MKLSLDKYDDQTVYADISIYEGVSDCSERAKDYAKENGRTWVEFYCNNVYVSAIRVEL